MARRPPHSLVRIGGANVPTGVGELHASKVYRVPSTLARRLCADGLAEPAGKPRPETATRSVPENAARRAAGAH